jgi:hypothetical protein
VGPGRRGFYFNPPSPYGGLGSATRRLICRPDTHSEKRLLGRVPVAGKAVESLLELTAHPARELRKRNIILACPRGVFLNPENAFLVVSRAGDFLNTLESVLNLRRVLPPSGPAKFDHP